MIDILAEPSATNLAWQWVSAVLPPDGSSPWGRTLQVFTSVLAFLASLGLAYSVVSGIVQSAYTGKVLGERWHQIWSPLRIVVGFGLLVPLPNTGFSSVHYILRDVVARGGINVADAAWNTFVGVIAKDGVPIVPVSHTGSTVAMAVLRHEICAAVYNKAGSLWGWEQPKPDPAGHDVAGVTVWSYGATCGRFSYTIPEGRAGFVKARRTAITEMISAFRPEAARYATLAAETSGISSADGATNAITAKLLSPTLVQDIRAAGAKFDATIAAAAKAEVMAMDTTSRSKLVGAAKTDGFLTAGMYWRALAQISELTTSLTNERLDDTLPRTDGDFGQAIERAFSALALQVSGEAERVNLTANDFASAGDETADFLTKLLGQVARDMAEWATSSGSEGNAMSGLISSGHAMIAGGWAIITAGAGAAALAGNAITRFFGAAGVDWLLDWSKYVVGALMVIGSLRAYVIPMMPFIFMFMAGMATLAALMEAMIALPLWATKWLKLDNGGDFAGESVRMGLLLTVNIALRPVLAVLALCVAYPVFNATLGTLDKLWATAFLGQTGGHVVGLVGILVMTGMHMYLTWHACMKGFGQIWSLPDRVLAWTGQPGAGGEASLTSGAFGGMLALAGRGNLPKTGLRSLASGGKKK
ncbi:DotA/TraY family protein [Agrobacterium tumefaciens]|jgi:conjugal transfer/type IV secretion protein DotA/TraY|uniref:DotA/TraY family protein n=1 Tax=Agrobacterium tumefaciens TaxID=358 RepID=UPI001CBA729C|nr:DotA/TraY family protein [Agrobacterium tumefaciens]